MAIDANRIHKPFRKLRKLLKKNPRRPTPDQIHDLRTNTRRLEATIHALSLDSERKSQSLLKNLARIRRRAGDVRDMDVLTGFASSVRVDGEQDCKVELLEHLGAERRKDARKLHTTVAKYGTSARDHLKQTSRRIDPLLSNQGKDVHSTAASAQAAASALKIESQLAARVSLGRDNLHPYRLKVKELRNVLTLASNADNQEFIDTLGKVKDAIGEWHDWEELLAIAKDVLDHGTQCKLLRELKHISDQKYEAALSEAENMRRKYLRVTSNKNKRRPPQPADAVWQAMSAIAA